MSSGERVNKMQFFHHEDARSLDDDGMMTPVATDRSAYEHLDLRPLYDGSVVTVLFKGEGPDAFSLVHAWFGAGYRLPRHSHDSDCLYYVLSGEITMGSRTVKTGEGFFVQADAPYGYIAGPDGAQVLEFRSVTSFNIKVHDKTLERWQPIVDAALANHATWLATRPDRAAQA